MNKEPTQEQIIGTPVKCENCGLKWLRITAYDNPGGIVFNEDIQYNCPKCGSNWYEVLKGKEKIK